MMGSEEILGLPLLEWISLYGYWIIIPLMIIEGTLTGFIAGVLSSLGVFNPFTIWASYIVAKLIADTFVYLSAYEGRAFLDRFARTRAIMQRAHASGNEKESFVNKHFVLALFLAKVLPLPWLDIALLITAGTLRYSPKRVYTGIILGQPIWSAVVIGLGYFYGGAIQVEELDSLLMTAGLFVIGLILVVMLYERYLQPYIKKRFGFDSFMGG